MEKMSQEGMTHAMRLRYMRADLEFMVEKAMRWFEEHEDELEKLTEGKRNLFIERLAYVDEKTRWAGQTLEWRVQVVRKWNPQMKWWDELK